MKERVKNQFVTMSAFPEFTRGGELLFAFDEAGAKAVLIMGIERGI